MPGDIHWHGSGSDKKKVQLPRSLHARTSFVFTYQFRREIEVTEAADTPKPWMDTRPLVVILENVRGLEASRAAFIKYDLKMIEFRFGKIEKKINVQHN